MQKEKPPARRLFFIRAERLWCNLERGKSSWPEERRDVGLAETPSRWPGAVERLARIQARRPGSENNCGPPRTFWALARLIQCNLLPKAHWLCRHVGVWKDMQRDRIVAVGANYFG